MPAISRDNVPIPDVLLVLGSDASGKNHVANAVADILFEAGHRVEKREGWFSGRASEATTSENKTRLSLLLERLFILSVPLTRLVMSAVLALLIVWDLKRFGKSDGKIVVISHTPVRVLAFYLGHIEAPSRRMVLAPWLDAALKRIRPATGAGTIVLDIADETRKSRLDLRRRLGLIDQFDLYMARDAGLSERIEDVLVDLARTYLDAVRVENDDSDDRLLKERLLEALSRL